MLLFRSLDEAARSAAKSGAAYPNCAGLASLAQLHRAPDVIIRATDVIINAVFTTAIRAIVRLQQSSGRKRFYGERFVKRLALPWWMPERSGAAVASAR
jgi:hypothetical protein